VTQEQHESNYRIYSRITSRLRALVKNCRPVPPLIEGSLFHYTTATGLIGIVSTATLWATASEYLNDPQEWKYGAGLAAETLKRLGQDLEGPVLAAAQLLLKSLESPSLGRGWYGVCFCGKQDVLSQWRGYSDRGGGYCLELASSAVQKWAGQHEASLIQVEYNPAVQKGLLEMHIRCALSKIQQDLSANSDPEKIWQEAAETQLRTVVLPLILRFKHSAFESEGEFRLGYFLGSAGIQDEYRQIEFRPGKGFVIPYLPLAFADQSEGHADHCYAPAERALPILSVWCGPTTHSSLGISGVEALMERYGYEVPVNLSSVPYRD
jgi:hypothetical protein